MSNQCKVISVASSKGGVGKSTITTILATTFFNIKKRNVAILEVDPQKSISNFRAKELRAINGEVLPKNSKLHLLMEANKETMNGKRFFDVHYYDINNDFAHIEAVVNQLKSNYDFIFIDFPGSLQIQQNAIKLLKMLDYIFIPFYADENNASSTLHFARSMKDLVDRNTIKAKYYLFFNRYNGVTGKNSKGFVEATNFLSNLQLPLMETFVYDSIEMQNFSTISSFAPSNAIRSLSHFIEDVYNKVN